MLDVLLHHPQVANTAMFAVFLCVEQRPGGHCIAGHIIIAYSRRRRRRRRPVTAVTETDTDQ